MEISVTRIAEIIEGEIVGNPKKNIQGTAPFENADEDDITFAATPKLLKKINTTLAGTVIVPKEFPASLTPGISKTILKVDNPKVAFAKVLELFYAPTKPESGISPQASIGKNFKCGQEISIAPFVAVQDNVSLGERVRFYPHVFIGNNVAIGSDVVIYPNVTILEGCRIGNRVIIHAGSVIGSDGFGYAPDGEKYYKIIHTGIVQIDDDVEIGAGNTIDRATFGKTWIKSGVKTDNLVHIAHNVTVGENTVLIAQVGISGSVTIGKHAILAGQAGVAGHLTIGDDVIIGAQTGIGKSVTSGQVLSSGTPGMPHKLWLRVQRVLPKLPEFLKKFSDIEKRLKKIEEKQIT